MFMVLYPRVRIQQIRDRACFIVFNRAHTSTRHGSKLDREISWSLNSCWVLRRSVTRRWDREWAKWSYSWPPRDPLTTRILEQSPTTFYTTGTLIFKAKDRPILTNRQWIGYYVVCTFTYNQAPLIADFRALNKFKSKLHYYIIIMP